MRFLYFPQLLMSRNSNALSMDSVLGELFLICVWLLLNKPYYEKSPLVSFQKPADFFENQVINGRPERPKAFCRRGCV